MYNERSIDGFACDHGTVALIAHAEQKAGTELEFQVHSLRQRQRGRDMPDPCAIPRGRAWGGIAQQVTYRGCNRPRLGLLPILLAVQGKFQTGYRRAKCSCEEFSVCSESRARANI